MLNLLSITVFLPLLGAGGVLLASFLVANRDVEGGGLWIPIAAAAVAVATLVSVLLLRAGGAAPGLLSLSRLPLLAESVVKLHFDSALWPLAVGLSFAACLALFAEVVHMSNTSPQLVIVLLGLLALGLATLWSANPLTTVVTWSLYDMVLLLGQTASGARNNESVLGLALGSGAVLLLWGGVLVAGDGTGTVQWSLMPAGGAKMTFWVLAGLLRLGVYPLHLSTPSRVDSSSPLVTMLFLSPVVGWGLWIRLALVNDGVLPVDSWVMVPAVLTVVAGGFLAWTAKAPRRARPWIAMSANGAVLVSAVLASLSDKGQGAGESVALWILALGAASWMLSTSLLFSRVSLAGLRGLSRKTLARAIPGVVGAFSLLGGPLTLGFVAGSYLMRALTGPGQRGWAAAFFVGQLFLVAAVGRWLFASEQSERKDTPLLGQGAYDAGLTGAALALVAAGLIPMTLLPGAPGLSLQSLFAQPSLIGWLLWGATFMLGSALAWQDRRLRPAVSLWLNALHDVVRLEWAYGLLTGAFEQGLAVVRAADDILAGRGALLWSIVILLIVLLARGVGVG